MPGKKNNNSINLRAYRNKFRFNIGNFVFGIIAIYLIITVLMYITARHVSVYEVREGSITEDNAYTGLCLREEETLKTDESGYINFYVTENTKVGANTNIYTITQDKLDIQSEQSSEDQAALTSDEQTDILQSVQNFNDNYKDRSFSDTYALKSNIASILDHASNSSKLTRLDELIQNGIPDGMTVYKTEKDGIVLYASDNYDGMTVDTFKKSSFDKSNYKTTVNTANTKVEKGSDAYKLITNDQWKVVIPLTKKTASDMSETSSVKVKIKKDNQTLQGKFSIIERDGSFYGIIVFDTAMIRYGSERFLDLELIVQDESGLKIPKSAVVNKSFYVVPDEYITKGGDSNKKGVYRKKAGGSSSTEFLAKDVYYSKDGQSYLDPDDFEKGDTLIMPDSSDTLALNTQKKLKGVYNINKGYAVFKLIHILSESNDYYIVQEGSDYGLTNYDHIALDGNVLGENDIVF